ncbi:ImmA/IrrE family metallo-endopeptidase [Lysobacter claricitrinus]|uniref:ImmA/IrrE family metallo-endopeptidase n=1 Tax=Lysobacter claricitrinus TaxID=3367728 RepID=UPI0037DB9165
MAALIALPPQRRIQIAHQARFVQMSMWNDRQKLWRRNVPAHPMDVLDPGVALLSKGYEIESTDTPGVDWDEGRQVEIAGTLDPEQKVVTISTKLSREAQLFTAAHELGHVVLHAPKGIVHRDRASNGPTTRRSQKELEADYFASVFLMPERQVRQRFEENFLTQRFVLTEETAFALYCTSITRVINSMKCTRGISLALAQAITYGGRHVQSMSSMFQVSPTAMAIRMEELDLIGT